MHWFRDRAGTSTFLAIAVALVYQILVPPVVGLANNGDFAKVTGHFDLDWPKQDDFKYIVAMCPFGPAGHWDSGFRTSAVLLASSAMTLNRVVTKVPFFDLRCIGAVHAGIFLVALGLLLPLFDDLPRRASIVPYACIALLFTDAMYATYFNSFMMDAAAIVFFVLAVAFYARVRRYSSRTDSAGLLIACVLFVATKPQHAPLCLPIAGLIAWVFWRDRHRRFAVFASAAILGTGLFTFKLGSPSEYAPLNTFNMIFLKILPSAKDPAAELEELGLDVSFKPYIGMYAYWPNSPMQSAEFVREFGRRTSHSRLGSFFVRHPARAYRVIREALNEAGRIRPPLGNFDRSTGLPEFTETQAFTLSSGIKRAAFENRGSRYLFLFLGIALLMLSGDFPGMLALVSTGVLAIVIAGLGDAVDHARHFAVFHTIVDVMIVAVAAAGVHRWAAWRAGCGGAEIPSASR